MLSYQNTLIARQGLWPFIIVVLLALVVNYQLGWQAAAGLWGLAAIIAFLFRDPRREVPPTPLAIVAPIDGQVVAVDHTADPYLQREAVRIQVHGHWWGVFTVRSVMEGKVNNQWFGTLPEGSDQSIYKDRALPPFAQWTRSDEEDDVITTLSPRFGVKGSRCYVQSGERVGQGKRCSFVPFGAKAEIFMPANSRIDVKPGDEVKAGSSIVGVLQH
ncbi:MAG: phosphatidylserine decarboxylase [Gammaproteobacteria bacterium]|jgi:phosphatidylserine decarboxylase